MKVLYTGGTGEISYSCIHEGVKLGQQITILNRGNRKHLPLPAGVREITGNQDDDTTMRKLADEKFDVVCQFLAFDVKRIEKDIEIFGGKCGQYVFISSASGYQKPPTSYVITEQTPMVNPYWPYSAAKAACEKRLMEAHHARQLPVTIMRPSHTYRTHFPVPLGWDDLVVWRMQRGKTTIVHGDGSSLWTVTHSDDFAVPFVRLLGNPKALGEAFHITTDEAVTWNQLVAAVGDALGVPNPPTIHVSTQKLCQYNPDWVGPLVGDKSNSVIFDNSKVKRVAGDFTCRITMPQGMKRVAQEYYLKRAGNYVVDQKMDALYDRIVAEQSENPN